MADVHDKQTRSRNMSAIKNKDTKPELWLRKQLHARGFRYRINSSKLPGKPDLVFPKYKAVIFVHGCFWHMHSCPLFKVPQTRAEWWMDKFTKNKERDDAVKQELEQLGWRVLTVWECTMKGKGKADPEKLLNNVSTWLTHSARSEELSS